MKTILTVDDSASMRQMVGFTLRTAGYHVVEAADGEEGYTLAMGQDLHLVLTDQNMPKMDGMTLVKKLREHARFKNTPILMLTTEASEEMKAGGRKAGATGWLVKPFDPNRLLEVIGKVLP